MINFVKQDALVSFILQSISLTQPIMGTHLINAGASMGSVNHVIRTTMTQAAPSLVPSSNTTAPRQIVLPAGQTVIPRQPVTQQATASAAGFSKNVVLRQINPSVQSVIVSCHDSCPPLGR